VNFKEGMYQRLAAGEWLAYHFSRDLNRWWGEGIWDDIKFFSAKHAKRLTDIVVSMNVRPLPPHMWYIYSPVPPKRWYDALSSKEVAFNELYEMVIGFSELYGRLINRHKFEEEFLNRHLQDWELTKRKMRNLMGR